MKRSFERKAYLRAFRCDLATLESFTADIAAEFSPDSPKISIHIDLPGEDLQFDSFDEIKSFKALPASITKFSIRISSYNENGSRYINLIGEMYPSPYIRADSTSESWCAGVVDKTKRFAENNCTWYWFIRPWMLYTLMIITAVLTTRFGFTFFATKQIGSITSILEFVTLLVLLVITGYLYFANDRVFSPSVLLIRSEESWVKKYSTELTIGAALISAFAAIYSALIR